MKQLLIGFLAIVSFSAFAQEKSLACLSQYNTLAYTEGYAIDYLNSHEAEWINKPIDDAFEAFPPAGVVMVLPVLAGAVIVDITTMPIAISKRIKGKRGSFYLKAISIQSTEKAQRAYEKLMTKAREINSEISEEKLNLIIMNGYSNVFCKNKRPMSKHNQMNYILEEVRKTL